MTSKTTLPLYLIATGTSLFGNASISIVLPWLVLQRTGDPAVAGLVAAVSALPAAIAAFAGGHLVDRVGRRRMTVIADIGSAVAVASLALVDAAVGLDVGWFILLGVLGALFDVPGMTARETLLANVSQTSGTSLDRIASLRGALFGLSFLAGPALAGWLLAVFPAITVVWITAACSAIAALAVAVMPLDPTPPAEHADPSPLAGWTHIRRNSALLALLTVSLASMVIVGPLLSIVLPAHFTALAAPGLLGLTLSAYAVGTIAGSGLYGWLFDGRRWAAWVTANALYTVGGLLIGTLAGVWPVALGMVAAGIGSGLMQPITTVVLTEQVPDALRGRVFGTYAALQMAVAPLGLGAMAALLGATSLGVGAWALAGGWVLLAAWSVALPGLRDYIRGGSGAREEAHADDRPAG
ncbi:MFS transporter [Propioniciclava coleopterorum]|uniref:Multidrug efflux pump Tap n=1 Tax=Propioniciclava coleopterorum TaxID=2714937 RepID=A0A6G7Y948_9ACTN|nr:MFS transporter [Propioniciclava coleopterorum]QIK73239.1 MFS transporter [Propioniciclava coleopterorum]